MILINVSDINSMFQKQKHESWIFGLAVFSHDNPLEDVWFFPFPWQTEVRSSIHILGAMIHKVGYNHFIVEKTTKKFCSFKSLLTEDPSWTLTVVELCVKSVEA